MPGSTSLRIAIIGAGPVSLTLANILQNNHVPFTVFEASDRFRTAGGSLDLHPESGQLALKEAGLWRAFVDNSRPESDCTKVVNLDGEVLWDENELEQPEMSEEEKFAGRPEIDRRLLMKILFDNLSQESIVFGRRLEKVVPSDTIESKYDLLFTGGAKATDVDLVIGADGAWSKVRQLLSDIKPQYSGISVIELWHQDIDANPWLLQYIGRGSMYAFGEGQAVMSQRQSDGTLRTYAALCVPEDFLETCGIDWADTSSARQQTVERYFTHIGIDLKRVVLECKDALTPRPLFELPIGFRWSSRPGVTLIGDAAHVMTPFAGVGVNVGMTDALILGRELIAVSNKEKSLNEAVQVYETEMFPRAQKYAEKTMRGKANHFKAEGSREFADMLRSVHESMR